jgi:hypothetical protein
MKRGLALSPTGWGAFTAMFLCPILAQAATLSFTPYVSDSTTADLGANAYPCAVVTADFNKDGKPDVVIANRGASSSAGSSAVFFAGNGAGAFTRGPGVSAFGAGISDLVHADFNKDGKLDLVAVQCFNNQVQMLLGNGDGTFTAGSTTAVGAAPSALVVGDFNRDGKPDVAVVNTGAAAPWGTTVSVRLGDGSGGFTSAADLTVSAGPDRIFAADFNRDGKLDLAVGSSKSGVVRIYTGNGDGTFNTTAAGSISVTAGNLTADDVNADGKLDLIIGATGSEGVRVALGQGTGAFDAPVAYGAGLVADPVGVAVTDMDGDGVRDLVVTDSGSPGGVTRMAIFTGVADGTFAATPTSFPLAAESGVASALAVGDFNRDGRPDVVATILNAGTLSVILNTTLWPSAGTTLNTPTTYNTDYSFAYALAGGDFNRDGNPDLAVGHSSAARLQTYLGSASGTFTRFQDTAPATFFFLVAGDFNRDGNLDVVASRGADAKLQVLLNDGTGTLSGTATYGVDATGCRIAIGDLNGDGILDLVVANVGNNNGTTISVLLGKGDGTFNAKVSYTTPVAPQYVALGDFDGDGDLDVVVTVYSLTTGDACAEVFMNNGDGTLAAPVAITGRTQASGVVAADFDRDGDVDLAIGGNSVVGIWLNDGTGTFPATPSKTRSMLFQIRPLAAADLNRDGILDLVAGRYQTGANPLAYALGNGDGSFQTPKGFSGGAGNRMAPALVIEDFNRDGAPDIAMLQPTLTSPYASQLAVFINKILPPTTTTLGSSLNPSDYGDSVTLTATVSPSAATGNVVFKDGATTLGTGTLSGGTATLATSALTAGSHSLTAEYSGDSNYLASTNSPALTQTVDKATPTATLAVNNSPVTYDGSAKSATVGVATSSTPGSVANIQTGGAVSQTAAGTYAVTADFVPSNTNYKTLTAQSAGNFVINKATPSVSTWPTASAIVEGQSLADATLTGGVTAPTGGTFAFDSLTTKPPVGTASHAVTYTPADTANYATVAGSVSVTVNPATVTRTAAANGNWNDPNTWTPAGVPAAGDAVVVPTGIAVTVDGNTAAIGNLIVQGTLAFAGSATLKVGGNITFESTATFTPGTGTVELVGSTGQTLSASAPAALTFYNLKLNKDAKTDTVTALSKLKVTRKLTVTKGKLVSASDYLDILIEADGELELTSDITVGGNLEVQAGGTLTTATHKITFDGATVQNLTLAELVQFDDLTVTAGTTLVETDPANNVLVNGTVLNQGVIRKSQALDVGEYYNFGLAGNYAAADMEIRVTDRTGTDPLSAIQVDRIDANHPHPPGSNTTGVYWTITPTGSDFIADLTLPHAGLASPRVSRYTGSGWVFGRTGFTADTVTLEGVTAFSDWAVYNVGTPVANPATYSRGRGMSLKIAIADIASDPDGNPLTVVSAGPSVEGATISWNETYVFYRLAGDQGDSFPYTVSNGAESAANTVTVTVPPTAGGLAQEVTVGEDAVTVKFYGIPGLTYDVQRATTLSPPDWTTLNASPLALGADGSFEYTDDTPPPGQAYYRSVRH